jgi:hypothetical protein
MHGLDPSKGDDMINPRAAGPNFCMSCFNIEALATDFSKPGSQNLRR